MNYDITLSGGIIDPKHREKIGIALWEFVWCLDKVTKIDEDGTGWVLGGIPIKYVMLEEALGIPRVSIQRNIARLKKKGYLITVRTPYGAKIGVVNVKKKFKKKHRDVSNMIYPDVSNMNRDVSNMNRDVSKTIHTKKTYTKTITKTKGAKGRAEKKSETKFNPDGAEIIHAFIEIDPKNKNYYQNKTQRSACDFLIEEYGLAEVLKRIPFLMKSNKIPYFPTITTPVQLRDKWVQLHDAVERKKQEHNKSASKIAF